MLIEWKEMHESAIKCTIEWDKLPLSEWEMRFAVIRRANLLQSYDYARAICPVNHQKARWGLILIDGREAGLVQILEAGILGNMLHGVILDRGPLWFEGFGTLEEIDAFFTAFDRIFPRRMGRRRRVLPEAPDFSHEKFRRLPYPGYQTIWLDLTKDTEVLKKELKSQWRNKLGKAERAGLEVQWDEMGETLPWLLTKYQPDKAKKEYEGPSPHLLRRFSAIFAPKGAFLIGRAMIAARPVAAILVLCHGTGATYQVGWSSEEGRQTAAHNFLLWQVVCHLKDKGIKDFDLGGINDEKACGVRDFKEGMGGEKVSCAGWYL